MEQMNKIKLCFAFKVYKSYVNKKGESRATVESDELTQFRIKIKAELMNFDLE